MFRKIHNIYERILKNRIARYWVKEWLEPILIAFVLAMFIRAFFLQAFKIPTGSMRNTLLEGDRILVNKCVYWFKQPERGDVIVFKYPLDEKRDFIKRLIGKPGETIRIVEGDVFVDGKEIEVPEFIKNNYYYAREDWPYGKSGMDIKVPDNSYFVLGDNSAQSSDSRYWGFVARDEIRGRAFFVYWPVNRWRLIH